MYEEYNKCFAVSEGCSGRKEAAYNTKLMRSLMTEITASKNVVLVIPEYFREREWKEARKKVERAGHKIVGEIRETVSAVLFHSTQYHQPVKNHYIRVINIGESGTDITLVRCAPNEIVTIESMRTSVSGRGLTETLAALIKRTMQGKINTWNEGELLEKAEKLKIRMGSNNLRKESVELTGKVCKISRAGYEACCEQWIQQLFKVLDNFDYHCNLKKYPKADTTILCGGGGEADYIFEMIQKKYEGSYVTNYKARDAAVLGAAIYAKRILD